MGLPVKPGVLDSDISLIKIAGQTKVSLLSKRGVYSNYDLMRYFPRDYEDRTAVKQICDLTDGEAVCVVVTVTDAKQTFSERNMVRARAADDSGKIDFFFFNQPYIVKTLKVGETFVFFGKAETGIGMPKMVNPVFEPFSETSAPEKTRRVSPVYSLTAGIRQWQVASAVRAIMSACVAAMPDVSSRKIREEYGLCETGYAYENIHFPPDMTALSIARRRLMFDELYAVAALTRRVKMNRAVAGGIVFRETDISLFIKALPFTMTQGQSDAIRDCISDTVSGSVMSRLIQGDVGSGKTAVALAMCFLAVKNGKQAALMAPTELLADQHYNLAENLLGPLGVRVERLTGSLTKKKRDDLRAKIAFGEVDLVVGTHAVISDGVKFSDLALAVIDEQHRFGVNQRAKIADLGKSVHMLVMSATPIPRSLNLILCGDLDVSLIRELPPGRQPVGTFIYTENKRQKLYNSVRNLVSEGRQVYIICPAVEDEPSEDAKALKSAKAYAQTLQKDVFPGLSVGLVYGGLASKDKDKAMRDFAEGKTSILVATTVVEVGVDVPNAALMIIENADMFGLSQLHQLRGRVGRGKHESYCVLMDSGASDTAAARLRALSETNDGFQIAEKDLEQRGPGDFIGSRQHGLPTAKFAGAYSDYNLLESARSAAERTLAEDPQLALPENRGLAQFIEREYQSAEASIN